MNLNDIISGTYAGLCSSVGISTNPELVKEYLDSKKYLSESDEKYQQKQKNNMKKVKNNITSIAVAGGILLGSGALGSTIVGCSNPTGSTVHQEQQEETEEEQEEEQDEEQEEPQSASLNISGIEHKINNNYTNVRTGHNLFSKNYIDIGIDIENGTLTDVIAYQNNNNENFYTGTFTEGRFQFDSSIPNKGLFDIQISYTDDLGTHTETVSGFLSGGNDGRLLYSGQVGDDFNNLDDAFSTGFGGTVGSQFFDFELQEMFNPELYNIISSSDEFIVGNYINSENENEYFLGTINNGTIEIRYMTENERDRADEYDIFG